MLTVQLLNSWIILSVSMCFGNFIYFTTHFLLMSLYLIWGHTIFFFHIVSVQSSLGRKCC